VKALIIDDEEDIRLAAHFGLQLGGVEVVVSSSGSAGVRTAAIENPDVILLDSVMPGLDGMATLRMLRLNEETRHIPVIFLTAQRLDDDLSLLDALGVAGVISKPFNPRSLASEIFALLEARA
jgi:two-component system, OmpR family, alkaline phosphatase synthesis response regulator PhoP